MTRRLMARVGWTALRAANRAGVLSRQGLSAEVELNGRTLRVPLWSGIGLDHSRMPDRHLLGVLRALLSLRDGAFVDVGAHVGQTLVKLLVLGDPRPYLGFEPKPRAAAYVEALLAANGRAADCVLAAAAGEVTGVVPLSVEGDLDDGARVVHEAVHDRRRGGTVRPVPSVRGDEAVAAAGLGAVGLLKIDAEEAELEVVRGFARTIERDRPPILCEILPFSERDVDRHGRAAELKKTLAALGYSMHLCDAGGRIRPVAGAESTRSFAERDFVFLQDGEAGLLGRGAQVRGGFSDRL